ncbi:MAG: efflux RND transporter periplasmic adaptor subunit [Anaeromyxobacteraceae bacterium]
MSLSRKVSTRLVAALVLSSSAVAVSASEPPSGRQAAAPVPVKLARTEAPSGGSWIAARLAAARSATLSTRISATVAEILVEEGSRVTEGQLLVRLSDADVRAQLDAAETALKNATAYEKRITELVATRAATPVELEQAEAQRAQAAAAVAGTKATIAHSQLRAPFAGTVQARRVNVGDLVGPGQPILELEGGALELQATLSDAEARGLRIGQRTRFATTDAQGEAEITALTPGGDALTHRRSLRASVLGTGTGLRSGMFARLEVPGGATSRTAWVPRTALVERGDLTGVFVAKDGKAHLRWLALGEPVGDRVPVRAGLEPGEQVIDAPGALRDGQQVEVVHGG